MIGGAIEVVVQQDRLSDGRRVVTAITALAAAAGEDLKLSPIFIYDNDAKMHHRVAG
jgi:Flp pilus assembly CpaF family ATPase